MEKACSYQIFTDGTTAYAQSCGTGAILDASTDAAGVIDDAIGNLTSGGKIFIKAGTYTLTTTRISLLTPAAIGTTTIASIELYGEGNATILAAGTNLNGMVIGVTAGGWYIHDLQVNGNRASQNAIGNTGFGLNGIWLEGNDETVEHCYVHDDKTYGIVVGGNNVQILNNKVLNNNANGIELNPLNGGTSGSNSLVEGNFVSGDADVGISLSGENGAVAPLTHVICTENIVKNINIPSGGYGAGILIGDNGIASQIVVSDNQVYYATYGIATIGNGGNNTDIQIADNIVNSTTQYGIYGASTNTLTVNGNTVTGFSPTTYGMRFNAPITNLKVTDNTIHQTPSDTGSTDIQVTVPYALVEGNYATGIIDLYAPYDSALNNIVVSPNYASLVLDTGCNYCSAIGNTITNTASNSAIAIASTVLDALVEANTVHGSISDSGTGTKIINNPGYNPLGNITSPFVSSSDTILDSGGSSTPVNATTMTVWESPKLITVVLGPGWDSAHTLVIKVDGTQIISTTTPVCSVPMTFTLQPGETFYIQYETGETSFYVSGA